MITNFKIFENLNREPKVGDYVICKEDNGIAWTEYTKKVENFINGSVGRIDKIRKTTKSNQPNKYTIQYFNVPSEIKKAFFTFGGKDLKDYRIRILSRKEIVYFSNNKEDCEVYLSSKKYNL